MERMPFAADTPPVRVERPCAAAPVFAELRQTAAANPALAFACAPLLASEPQRDSVQREAFLAAATRSPEVAARYLPQLIERPWITDAGFLALLTIARQSAEFGRQLLLKAAARYPSLALREFADYRSLPFGSAVFEQAAISAPDEAVGLAGGASATGQGILEALRASASQELQCLARIATSASLADPMRQRVAVFAGEIAAGRMTMDQAVDAARGSHYFAALVPVRLHSGQAQAAVFDRVLENYAEVLFRTMEDRSGASPELASLSARDVYLLLTYGRTEEDDKLFGAIFDRLLLPKLHHTPLAKLLDEVHDLNLRRFVATAVSHHRLEALLATVGARPEQMEVLARCMRGLGNAERPLDEMVAAAQILDAIQDSQRLNGLKRALLDEYAQDERSRPLIGLLAASLDRKLTRDEAAADPNFASIATKYGGYLRQPRLLDVAALFNAGGLCIQQQFFYDDGDGNESFDSFQQAYGHDPAWHWEDRGWYVRVTGKGFAGRQVEIYANVPHSEYSPGSENRRHALTKLLAEQGLAPSVLIHRGHTWYVVETLEYLTNSAKLVYLGSCRGLMNAYPVIALSNRAQMIATSGIGTTSINDSLLKAINDELLKGEKTLDWESFWHTQEGKLGSHPMFRDYLPPSRNAAAIMLTAYYDYLADGK